MNILDTATAYWNAGLNTLPIRTDGSKAPAVDQWENWHTYNQGAADIHELFHGRDVGIAIIGGGVSGGLEVIDFDIEEAFFEWRELVKDLAEPLYEALTIVKSPRGFHVYIRSDFAQGNRKLASTTINGKKKTKVETRGKGGYVLAPGCPPSCHETSLTYDLFHGSLEKIPRLTEEQRTLLIDAARSLDEFEERAVATPNQSNTTPSGDRPGDDYDARASWHEILTPFGWRAIRERGNITYWCRPGKSQGISATTGVQKCGGKMFIFSSNAHPFEDGRAYSKFAAYLALNHAGDARAGAKALRALGYGKAERPRPQLVPPPNEIPIDAYENDVVVSEQVVTAEVPIKASDLDDLLCDDKAAFAEPVMLSRMIAARERNDAEWVRIEAVLKRHRVVRNFNEMVNRAKKKPKTSGDWRDRLKMKEKKDGSLFVQPCLTNVLLILTEHEDWRNVIGFDEFRMQIVFKNEPPFTRSAKGRWQDSDDTEVCAWLEDNFFSINPSLVNAAILVVAKRNAFNPLTDYLEALQPHDGESSLDTWLIDCFGAPDTPYIRAVGAKWMISAVARAYNPGCQADYMIVLEGDQGFKKSSVLRKLCPIGEWFSDGLSDYGSKAQAEEVEGKWIIEIGEMQGMAREQDKIKAFVTRREENYRPAYAKHTINSPRKCIFAGTINPDQVGYFRDHTGNRRYWPVPVMRELSEFTSAYRDRLWAEAVQRYKAKETWYLDDPRIAAMAKFEQAKRVVEDAWQEMVESHVAGRESVSTDEILDHMQVKAERRDNASQMRIGKIMMALGWTRKLVTVARGSRQRRYFPPGSQASLELVS